MPVSLRFAGDWLFDLMRGIITQDVQLVFNVHQNFGGFDIFDFPFFSTDCSKSNLSKDRAPPGSSMNMPQSFGVAMGFSLSETLSVATLPSLVPNVSHLHSSSDDSVVYLAPTADANRCWPIRPTLRNELDTFSVHFYVFFGPNISIPPDRAAVFAINLMPVLDSGGVLNMELKLNMVSASRFAYDSKVFCIVCSYTAQGGGGILPYTNMLLQ